MVHRLGPSEGDPGTELATDVDLDGVHPRVHLVVDCVAG
jgi:hypothetical protein